MDQIGNFKITGKLGEGGMGEVFKGVDVMLEREVAIKMLRPELSSRADVVDRFRSEAIALGRLNHSNIAAVYSFGQQEEQYYMVLEFVKGETLDAVIRRSGAVPWRDAVRYAISALEGLGHAHRFNIIHRDVKPANIMLTEQQEIKLMDFGIARILENARLTRSGYLVGTLEYMSPEQIRGEEADARADIYSLGVVLYEMLTGHLPFEKKSDYELIQSHIDEPPRPLHALSEDIPSDLERLVLRALEKSPAKRFANTEAFIRKLRLLLEERLDDGWDWGRLFRDYPIAVWAAVALLIVVGAFVFWKSREEPKPPKSLPPRNEIIHEQKKQESEPERKEEPAFEQKKPPRTLVKPPPRTEYVVPPILGKPLEDIIDEAERKAEMEKERAKQKRLKQEKLKRENAKRERLKRERLKRERAERERSERRKRKSNPPDIGGWAKDFFNKK